MSKKALEIAIRNNFHREALERLISEYGENDFILSIQTTPTPLVSAHLLADLNKHEIIRNMEGGDNMQVIRRILSAVDEAAPHWRYENHQDHRGKQYKEGVKRIEQRLECINRLKRINNDSDGNYSDEINALLKTKEQYELVLQYLRPVVRGTLHPQGSTSTTDLFDGWRLKGIYLRFAGPRKATQAGVWKRSAGAISINSYDWVQGEEVNMQIPSRTGTYGLTVRLVWGMWSDLVSHKAPIFDGVKEVRVVDRFNKFI